MWYHSAVCKRIIEEMIEGQQKEEAHVFSRAGLIYQEVHVFESGSAETALEQSDKNVE